MKNFSIQNYVYRGLLSLKVWLVLGCIGSGSFFSVIYAGLPDDYTIKTYEQAIKIAEKSSPIPYTNLIAAVPWDKNTIWNDDATMVLAVSWIPASYVDVYKKSIGQEFTTSPDFDMWVTLVPEIKKFCEQFNIDMEGAVCGDAKARLNQFLGLTPLNYGAVPKKHYNEYFIELWVRPEDLFRPCLNPDVSQSSCNLDPDLSEFKTWTPERMFELAHTPDWHRKWFLDNKKKAYPGFAWTRLGYTYDWNPFVKTHEGASELVIKRNTKIIIKAIYSFAEYCRCFGSKL